MMSFDALPEGSSDSLHTILVVEDEVLIRMMIAEYLRECGLQVVEAATGAEAIKVLAEGQMPIDLVFSDVHMPGGTDGFALAHWVRTNRPGLPVILTSGNIKVADKAREVCQDGPMIDKPYDHEALLQRLRKKLSSIG